MAKEQGSVKLVPPVIGTAVRIMHCDYKEWVALNRQHHFPVELYLRDKLTDKVDKKPEPQEWILGLKSAEEEEQEKREKFLEKLRQRNNDEVLNDLKCQVQTLKASTAAGISGQSQVKKKAQINFFAKKKKQLAKELEL